MEADMALDITSLENAAARLDQGLTRYRGDVSDIRIRDGLVQRLDFTGELSHRMIKRRLEAASATPGRHDRMPFADLIRSANEAGLLRGDWPKRKVDRDVRGRTSHTDNEAAAVGPVDRGSVDVQAASEPS